MKSFRLFDTTPSEGQDPVADVGADSSSFPTGVNHVINHSVPKRTHDEKTLPGSYLKDMGQGASLFHGVEPTETGVQIHDEWEQAQKGATMVAGTTVMPKDEAKPVPVYLVNEDSGSHSLLSWTGTSIDIPAAGGQEVQVLGKDAKRQRAMLKNEDTTNSIRIGKKVGNALFGFLLKAGDELEMFTQDEIRAIGLSGNITQLSVYAEYNIEGGL
jgi:hypothetical protein